MNQEPQPASSRPVAQPGSQPTSRPASQPAKVDVKTLSVPVVDGPFIRPADAEKAQPIWGHAKGLSVGLPPMGGPRGLLRIYAPYLNLGEGRVINFIAVEPIVQGRQVRGFSELEPSKLDNASGKRFWGADEPGDFTPRRPEDRPARGVLSREGDVQVLRVYVLIEPFDNGARPYLRLTFRSDRPQELGIATFAQEDSKPMGYCILTATMGNFARLRELHLAGEVVSSKGLYPDYRDVNFAPHRQFGLGQLFRTPRGGALVAATPDEADPRQNKEGFPWGHWRYSGDKATQYWRCEKPDDKLVARVNGRFTYYMSKAPIPGGIAFENFELAEPFREGAEFWFGATTQTPRELGIGGNAAASAPAGE